MSCHEIKVHVGRAQPHCQHTETSHLVPFLAASSSTADLPGGSGTPSPAVINSVIRSSSTPPFIAPAGALALVPAPASSPPATGLPIPQGTSGHTGAIVGGAVGGVIAAVALAGLTFCSVRRRFRKAAGSTPEDDNPWAVKEVIM